VDFFEAQEAARKRTTLLVVLFAAAVLAIVAVIYVVAHVGLGSAAAPFDPVLLAQVALGVGLVIAGGSAVRTASLRRGGPAVAELLGARRVATDTTDADERRLLNVVEEMALASGTPIPAVYVLDREDGINAFAAGYTLHDAAVAVTRGGLQTLTRDELQGVIAHEFSHILNGDMRLNIRLIGLLYGILLLAVIGRGIVYMGPRGGGRRGDRGGGAAWILLLGFALLLVGYIGVFFGRLIQAAVSRQREYLADSAAVEFTRNPDGLAGALKKIGAATSGSRIRDHHADELSHLFFASGVRSALGGVLATHPPLAERIRRLQPDWGGDFEEVEAAGRGARRGADHAAAAAAHGFEGTVGLAPPTAGGAADPAATAAPLLASVGAPTAEHLRYAERLLRDLPRELYEAAHQPQAAKALVLALLLPEDNREARALVAAEVPEHLASRVLELLPLVRGRGPDARLPLLDLALPALQSLTPEEADRLRSAVERLVGADGQVRLFEFALTHTLARRLGGPDADERRGRRIGSLVSLREETALLLSAIAWAGHPGDERAAHAAFEAGARILAPEVGRLGLRGRAALALGPLDAALDGFSHASGPVRRQLLEACATVAGHDRRLAAAEVELLRAIAEALDCPVPPVLG
jgi:Zn-dependent protease with chaperone function